MPSKSDGADMLLDAAEKMAPIVWLFTASRRRAAGTLVPDARAGVVEERNKSILLSGKNESVAKTRRTPMVR